MLSALRPPYATAQHAPAWLAAICSLTEPLPGSSWAGPLSRPVPCQLAAPAAVLPCAAHMQRPPGGAITDGRPQGLDFWGRDAGEGGGAGSDARQHGEKFWSRDAGEGDRAAACAEALARELMAATGACFQSIVFELHQVRATQHAG